MAGNQVQSFGYRLHAEQCFGNVRGYSIELAGVPTIPRALRAYWDRHGYDLEPPRELLPLIRESIEAACHVIQQRHLVGLNDRGHAPGDLDQQEDEAA